MILKFGRLSESPDYEPRQPVEFEFTRSVVRQDRPRSAHRAATRDHSEGRSVADDWGQESMAGYAIGCGVRRRNDRLYLFGRKGAVNPFF